MAKTATYTFQNKLVMISDNISNSKKYMSSSELTNDKIGKWTDVEKNFKS